MRGQFPGEFEQVVLLALAGFDDQATGRQIYEVITTAAERDVSVAAIHITLTRLHEKGWAECTTTAPAPGVGGKPRRRYALSRAGAEMLSRQHATHERLWDRALGNPLLRDERA